MSMTQFLLIILQSRCSMYLSDADCSICSDGHFSSASSTCNECSSSITGVVVTTILGVLIVLFLVFFLRYMVYGKWKSYDEGVVASWARHVLPCLKIVIVAWQILTQVSMKDAFPQEHATQLYIQRHVSDPMPSRCDSSVHAIKFATEVRNDVNPQKHGSFPHLHGVRKRILRRYLLAQQADSIETSTVRATSR